MTSGAMDYVELHCHSFYSLLDGTSAPADLVSRAADLGMDALALTDHDAVYGAVPFVTAARARHSADSRRGADAGERPSPDAPGRT
jgi:DNA polymerase III alpha subunit